VIDVGGQIGAALSAAFEALRAGVGAGAFRTDLTILTRGVTSRTVLGVGRGVHALPAAVREHAGAFTRPVYATARRSAGVVATAAMLRIGKRYTGFVAEPFFGWHAHRDGVVLRRVVRSHGLW
jgi:hypothetical protein